jgi:hypothetical protein
MITYVVTGFGQFQDVKDNPTTHLISWLQQRLDSVEAAKLLGPGVQVRPSALDPQPHGTTLADPATPLDPCCPPSPCQRGIALQLQMCNVCLYYKAQAVASAQGRAGEVCRA